MRYHSLQLLLCLALLGCQASFAPRARAAAVPGAVVPPAYWPAFEALAQALEAREDAAAQDILTALEARLEREPARSDARTEAGYARARELVEGYRRILLGRAFLQGVECELASTEVPNSRSVRLFLRVRAKGVEGVLRPGPASLRVEQASLTPRGAELHSSWTRHLEEVAPLHLAPGAAIEIPLGSYPLQVAKDSLAFRQRFALEFRAGEILVGKEHYPALSVEVASLELERLSDLLPVAPVEPSELARYAAQSLPWLPALLERAVRVSPERREEALDLLEPIVGRSSAAELERLAPALRWLSRRPEPSQGALGWKTYFEQRRLKQAPAPVISPLDLG